MKLRGSTGFTFRTPLRPEAVLQKVRIIVDGLVATDPQVQSGTVEFDGPTAIKIELVIASDTFGGADAAIDKLAELVRQGFASESSELAIDERVTELVPA